MDENKQTNEILRAFHSEKDAVFIRVFSDRPDEHYAQNYQVPMRSFNSILPTLERENALNRGIFFVVNGGGNTDKEVLRSGRCTAQFMECDNASKDEQIEKIKAFPLQPSIIIETRKSLHCYWLLKNGDIRLFRMIQQRLASYFDADPTVINESRVMRLPGFNHCKQEPFEVKAILFEPDRRYTQKELSAVLPELPKAEKPKTNVVDSTQRIERGCRVQTLVSVVGTLKARGLSDGVIRNTIKDTNLSMCEPPLTDAELIKQVYPAIDRFQTHQLMQNKRNPLLLNQLVLLTPHIRYKLDDRGNGNLYADCFNKVIRWNTTTEQWMYFDGSVWTVDEGGMKASNLGKQLYDALLLYASKNIEDEDTKARYVKHISKLGERREREDMLKDARDFYCIKSEELDADGHLLNCLNGTIDVRTRELTAHNPDQLISKICNATYDPSAHSDLWEWFVSDIMYGEVDKIEYLQKLSGYLLLGNSSEEQMYIFHGKTTRNGKSTFLETLAYMLGNDKGYALKVDPKSFGFSKLSNANQARGDIARLKGCRLAYTSEPDKQLTFDSGLLKQLTGQNIISARFNYGETVQFEPTFKIVVDCNNLPMITDSTLFDSDRVRVIPFEKHIPEEERDKTLKERLREPQNMSGILNWCLDGLEMYYRDGLNPPQSVIDATRDYQQASDKLGAFMAECMEISDQNSSGKAVYQAYQRWCRENCVEVEQKGIFFADLRARGLMLTRGTVDGVSVNNVVCGYVIA